MVVFCHIKYLQSYHFRSCLHSLPSQTLNLFLGQLFLLLILIKNSRLVLGANVFALTVLLSRVVDDEKDVQKG